MLYTHEYLKFNVFGVEKAAMLPSMYDFPKLSSRDVLLIHFIYILHRARRRTFVYIIAIASRVSISFKLLVSSSVFVNTPDTTRYRITGDDTSCLLAKILYKCYILYCRSYVCFYN